MGNKTIAKGMILLAVLFSSSCSQFAGRSKQDKIFVEGLGPGWNLGNTLDCHQLHEESSDPAFYETYWQNPVTTEEMIIAVKEAGFQTIRIPVTWYEHMDEEYHVSDAWMRRVKEVVDYGIQNGLYVIINAHHDPWYIPESSNRERAKEIMIKLWTQIAEYYADYDERLLFESMNEPRLIGSPYEWNEGTQEAREIVNEYNEVFVETIRGATGNNPDRYLLLPTYCASSTALAIEDFVLPEGERLIVSVHIYSPYAFAHDEDGPSQWEPTKKEDTQELDGIMKNLQKNFTSQNIPVIIGEFGAIDKDNEAQRAEWTKYIVDKANKQGIPCIWWDQGGEKTDGFTIFDRRTLEWAYPDILYHLTGVRK